MGKIRMCENPASANGATYFEPGATPQEKMI